MPDLKMSTFMFQRAEAISNLGSVASNFSNKLYETQRIAETNAGQVEVDKLFSDYERQFDNSIFTPGPDGSLPTAKELSEYEIQKEKWVRENVLSSITAKYKNKDAKDILTNYVAKKSNALGQYISNKYDEYQIGQIRTQAIDTAQTIADEYEPAQAKKLIGIHFASLTGTAFTSEQAMQAKEAAYKVIYERDTADLKEFITDINRQVSEQGRPMDEAKSDYEQRIDKSIALGSIRESDRARLMKNVDYDLRVAGAVGTAFKLLVDENGRILDGGIEKAHNEIVKKSGLSVPEQNVALDKLYDAYAKRKQYQSAVDADYDNPKLKNLDNLLRVKYAKPENVSAAILDLSTILEAVSNPKPTNDTWTFRDSTTQANAATAIRGHIATLEKQEENRIVQEAKTDSMARLQVLNYYGNSFAKFGSTPDNPYGDYAGLSGLLQNMREIYASGEWDGNQTAKSDLGKLIGSVESELYAIQKYHSARLQSQADAAAKTAKEETARQEAEQKQTKELNLSYFQTETTARVTKPFTENWSVQGDINSLYAAWTNSSTLLSELNAANAMGMIDPEKYPALKNELTAAQTQINTAFDKIISGDQEKFKNFIQSSIDSHSLVLDQLPLSPTKANVETANQSFRKVLEIADLLNSVPEERLKPGVGVELRKKIGELTTRHIQAMSGMNIAAVNRKNDEMTVALNDYDRSDKTRADLEKLNIAFNNYLSPETGVSSVIDAETLTYPDSRTINTKVEEVRTAVDTRGDALAEAEKKLAKEAKEEAEKKGKEDKAAYEKVRKEAAGSLATMLEDHSANLALAPVDANTMSGLNASFMDNVIGVIATARDPDMNLTSEERTSLLKTATAKVKEHLDAISAAVTEDVRTANDALKKALATYELTGQWGPLQVAIDTWTTNVGVATKDKTITTKDQRTIGDETTGIVLAYSKAGVEYNKKAMETAQANNAGDMEYSLLRFKEVEKLFSVNEEPDENGNTSIDRAYESYVKPIFENLGKKDIKSSDYFSIANKALDAAGQYMKLKSDQVKAQEKTEKEATEASQNYYGNAYEDMIDEAIYQIAEYESLGSPDHLKNGVSLAVELLSQVQSGWNGKRELVGEKKWDDLKTRIANGLADGREAITKVNKDLLSAANESKKLTVMGQWGMLSTYNGTGERLPYDIGTFKKGTVIDPTSFAEWIRSNAQYIEGWEGKLQSARSTTSDAVTIARTELKALLTGEDAQKKGVSLGEVFSFMNEFENFVKGNKGMPTDANIKAHLDSVQAQIDKKHGSATVLELGDDRSLSGKGIRIVWDVFNDKAAPSVAMNQPQRQAVAQQYVKMGKSYLGYDDTTEKALFNTNKVYESELRVRIGADLITVASAPQFDYKGKRYTFIPKDYDFKNGLFSGEIQIATVDARGIATPLKNQLPLPEIRKRLGEAQTKAAAKMNENSMGLMPPIGIIKAGVNQEALKKDFNAMVGVYGGGSNASQSKYFEAKTSFVANYLTEGSNTRTWKNNLENAIKKVQAMNNKPDPIVQGLLEALEERGE